MLTEADVCTLSQQPRVFQSVADPSLRGRDPTLLTDSQFQFRGCVSEELHSCRGEGRSEGTQEVSTRQPFALLGRSQSVDNKVSESFFFFFFFLTLRHRCLSSSAVLPAVGEVAGLRSQRFTEADKKKKSGRGREEVWASGRSRGSNVLSLSLFDGGDDALPPLSQRLPRV